MRHCLLIITTIILSIPPASIHLIGGSTFGALLDKPKYEQLFPHHHVIYSYENFLMVAKRFPLFAQEGNLIIRQAELAAFFAHIAHETTVGWAGAKNGPYLWGLYYTEEQACKGIAHNTILQAIACSGQSPESLTTGGDPFH